MTAGPLVSITLPSRFVRKRLCDVARLNRETLSASTDPGYTFRYIDISSVETLGSIGELASMPFGTAPSRARRVVAPDDIIVSTVRTYLRAIARIEDAEDVIASTGFAVVTPSRHVDPGYLFWWISSHPFVEQIVSQSDGVSYPAISSEKIGKMAVGLPQLEEQRRIAAFLDGETRAISRLALELSNQRDLLDERDRVAVKRLVTGIDIPGPRTTDGPWWLGSTPALWTPQKISRNFLTGSGTTPKSGDARYYGGPHYWLNTAECRDSVVSETAKTVTDEALAEYSSLKFYPVGSLVIAMYGATIGKLAVLGSEMTVNQACVVLHHPRELDTQFVYWWLWAHRAELISLGEGGGQPNISQEVIRQLVIPAPPLDVQRGIVDKIVKMRQWSQRMRDESDRQATLLDERLQAVITAAVTGQMEVA